MGRGVLRWEQNLLHVEGRFFVPSLFHCVTGRIVVNMGYKDGKIEENSIQLVYQGIGPK